jgi:hypothetical protein
MPTVSIRLVVAVAAFLAAMTFTPRLQAMEPPTIGETIGGQVGQLLADIRDGRILVNAFNAEVARARQQFWALYPDGPGIEEAEARFAELLWQKDLHFLHQSVVRLGIEGSDAFQRVAAALIGEIDDGIPRLARIEFGRWALAVHERERRPFSRASTRR